MKQAKTSFNLIRVNLLIENLDTSRNIGKTFKFKKMKKQYLILAMFFGMAISTTACKKCQTCTQTGYSDIEACREGVYRAPQLYDQYIRSLEDDGYECN